VATEITTPDQLEDATRARDALATYSEAADLIQIGAYVPGSDPRIDAARLTAPRVEALIRQKPDVRVSRRAARDALRSALTGDHR
jgi:flagellar biosynthesis/type III secretory pathway ATPase